MTGAIVHSGEMDGLDSITGRKPVALITGAARRIGRAIALECASRNCDVVLTCHTSHEDMEHTREQVQALGAQVAVGRIDLRNAAQVQTWGRCVAKQLPRLDVLVHNASTYDPSPLDNVDVEQAARQYRVNALSPWVLSAALADLLQASPMHAGGAIVAMLDIHSEALPRLDHAAYEMSKAALGAMVRSLGRELAPACRVNGVALGVAAWPESGPESKPAMQQRYVRKVPLARAGTPEEAARAVAFLAFEASYTTGHVLVVDGGRSLL